MPGVKMHLHPRKRFSADSVVKERLRPLCHAVEIIQSKNDAISGGTHVYAYSTQYQDIAKKSIRLIKSGRQKMSTK